MDRQNIIVASIAVVVIVAAGAFLFWPASTERATVATEQPAEQPAAEDSTSSTESGGY